MKKFIKSLFIIVFLLNLFIKNIYADDLVCILPQILINNACADPTPAPTTPTIIWQNPADIVEGTALSDAELNATSLVPGTFTYTPNIGTVLLIGTQTLSVTFMPIDIINYTTATTTVNINVTPAPSNGNGTPTTLNINADVDVPISCSATDTDGVIHNYPENTSSNSYLAICALETILKNGSISYLKLSNQYPSLGLFVTSFNNTIADPNSQYWAIYQNGNYATSGITSMSVNTGDVIKFQLHDFSDNSTGDQVTLNIHSLISNTTNINGGGGGIMITQTKSSTTKKTFDINQAYKYLISQQKENGSFRTDLYTDWSSFALASTTDYQIQKNKLAKYLTELKTENYQLTDYERHAMALMALNINPYNVAGENYIEKITKEFDGKQFGDTTNDNDDIFALVVLQNAGYNQNDEIIRNTTNFIISKQKDDGSWDGNVDMTGAGIEALSFLKENDNVKNTLIKAKEFLKQNQKDDGGFGNVSSTTWAMEGILALNEKIEDWTKNNNTPLGYLAIDQDTDGGIKEENNDTKIWETAYTLSTLSEKTWNQIMPKFGKIVTIDKKKNEDVKPIVKEIKTKPEIKNNIARTEVKSETRKNKIEKFASQNIASPLGAVNEIKNTIPAPKQNWFRRLINIIFGL